MSIPTTRSYFPGMGEGVADRTINRDIIDPVTGALRKETWGDVSARVALGNALLAQRIGDGSDFEPEREAIERLMRKGVLLTSGRHLQHGDADQPYRPGEVFTNCSTACFSFAQMLLLLNGSGVGRAYDDDLMITDYTQGPQVIPTISGGHADVLSGRIRPLLDAGTVRRHFSGREIITFRVPDSREGFGKTVEIYENLAWKKVGRQVIYAPDFSDVRPYLSPIKGMQNKPASGPGPTMDALSAASEIAECSNGMRMWRPTLEIDQLFAASVMMGNVRRAARMATKYYLDPDILDFIAIKKEGGLWTANHSVTVDDRFWDIIQFHGNDQDAARVFGRDEYEHAIAVWKAVIKAVHGDRSGEPGFITLPRLVRNDEGVADLNPTLMLSSNKYLVESETTQAMAEFMAKVTKLDRNYHIVNPCGEVSLPVWGSYCQLSDNVPFHADTDEEAEESFRVSARFLVRINTMDFLYNSEVQRANRIGVGMTGIFEYAWKRFGFAWKDLVQEQVSIDFWMMLARFSRAVKEEAFLYSQKLGMPIPHTDTTIKPSGTISKLFGLTEGAHLPTNKEVIRWVVFAKNHQMLDQYRSSGYPVRDLHSVRDSVIVGFPTRSVICSLGLGELLVTAGDATIAEQFEWLRLLEKYYIRGVDVDGNPLPDTGNQVSYTMNFDPDKVNMHQFASLVAQHQPTVRTCSFLPKMEDSGTHEYLPIEAISPERYDELMAGIERAREGASRADVECANGACPVDFKD